MRELYYRGSNKGSSSIYKGVSWHKHSKKWRAAMKFNKKFVHIGIFTTEREAAEAANSFMYYFHGEAATYNEFA